MVLIEQTHPRKGGSGVTFTWEQDDGGFKKALLRAIELNRRIDELGEAHERIAEDYGLSPEEFLRSWCLAVAEVRRLNLDPATIAREAVERVVTERNGQVSHPLTRPDREVQTK